MQSLLGTAPAFNPANGLYTRLYNGYFFDDVNYFVGATQLAQGVDTGTLQYSGTTNNSQQWLGYFKPNTSESYRFWITSDDASYFWIGPNAVNGFTTGNANINNGGLHSPVTVNSGLISLIAETYYPVRIQYGNYLEGGVFDFYYERVNSDPGVYNTNLTGLSFYNSSTQGL